MLRFVLPSFGLLGLSFFCSAAQAQPGTYSGPTGTPGAKDNPIARAAITQWETRVIDYSPAPGVGASFTNYNTSFASLGDLYSPVDRPDNLTGGFNKLYQPIVGQKPNSFHAGDAFSGDIYSKTDSYGFVGIDSPGSITLGFDVAIANGSGADFAVFENGFNFGAGFFAELAHVEVSTNGYDFIRFPSLSFNTGMVSTAGTFQLYDMTNVYNLAGKHASNHGTPFDLDELSDHALVAAGTVNLNRINYVRLVDVIGSGPLFDADNQLAWAGDLDSQENPILDNWITFDSGGFDYLGLKTGAIGVIHSATAVPEPGTLIFLAAASATTVYRRRRRFLHQSTVEHQQ